jgi:hypothetical protein
MNYEPPKIEQVVRANEFEREALYAGLTSGAIG